jgi:hypothetical protein
MGMPFVGAPAEGYEAPFPPEAGFGAIVAKGGGGCKEFFPAAKLSPRSTPRSTRRSGPAARRAVG